MMDDSLVGPLLDLPRATFRLLAAAGVSPSSAASASPALEFQLPLLTRVIRCELDAGDDQVEEEARLEGEAEDADRDRDKPVRDRDRYREYDEPHASGKHVRSISERLYLFESATEADLAQLVDDEVFGLANGDRDRDDRDGKDADESGGNVDARVTVDVSFVRFPIESLSNHLFSQLCLHGTNSDSDQKTNKR